VIEFYTKKIHDGYSMNDDHFYMKSSLNVYLLVFARKLIRSFFVFHRASDYYYDNHVTTYILFKFHKSIHNCFLIKYLINFSEK